MISKPLAGKLENNQLDRRSPLDRFRSQKAISVTDLTSPSWCGLQWEYSLETYGRKKQTLAMKQGSVVHKKLEDQVHKTVEVKVTSKEDAWGLRLWNVISGLRTLRDTGITRELELWGILDGQSVNGIVDELSYICPDIDLEGQGLISKDQSSTDNHTTKIKLQDSSPGQARSPNSRKSSKIYLTDVKTRTNSFVPRGASFRPTLFQLMLYHLLLSELATDRVNANIIFEQYKLEADRRFTDDFIAQVASISEPFYDAPDSSSQAATEVLRSSKQRWNQDPLTILLEHNSLHLLWSV